MEHKFNIELFEKVINDLGTFTIKIKEKSLNDEQMSLEVILSTIKIHKGLNSFIQKYGEYLSRNEGIGFFVEKSKSTLLEFILRICSNLELKWESNLNNTETKRMYSSQQGNITFFLAQ